MSYGKVLYIDLTKRDFWTEDRSELLRNRIGGTGVALELLKENIDPKCDPLGPGNIIVFAVGLLTGYYPLASKTVAMFKSPLTGNLGESHAGGRSAIAIRMAGYEAIVIKGVSDTPVYLVITNDGVRFRDASTLWGIRSTITVGRIIREVEGGTGIRSIIRIGRAGERLVRYACAVTETYRHFGRLGLGAVLGSKKLKAIVVYGKRNLPVNDVKLYRDVYDEIFKLAVETELMKKYHDIGTAINVKVLYKIGALPIMNLTRTSFKEIDKISGEYIAESRLGRRVACSHCPVACIHLAILREPYVDEPYFYKTTYVSYDYEPIYSIGAMLGVKDTDGLLRLLDLVETLGLDVISTGVALSWATEAYKRGVITERETVTKLDWGYVEGYMKAINFIVEQPNQFYRDLSMGVEYAARKYGGLDYALAFGGNEMPGYNTGPGTYLTYLTGARHSHLDSAGYSLDQKLVGKTLPSPEELIDMLMKEEAWRQVLSSLVICFFARGIYSVERVSSALKALGFNFTEKDLRNLGWEIYREKYKLKIELGFNINELRIPRRIFEIENPHGRISKEYLDRALKYFKKKVKSMISY